MFYCRYDLLQVKRNLISIATNLVYELSQELPKNLREDL